MPSKFNAIFKQMTIYLNFVVFFYSGVDKLENFDQFVNNFSKSPFAPHVYLEGLSALLIFFEIGFALMLLIRKTQYHALIGFGFLSLIFTTYIALMIFYSPFLPCSCGGIVDFLSWAEHLILTLVLTLSSFYAASISKI